MEDGSAEQRVDGEIALPIRYGTVAWQNERVTDQSATHRWLAFVRGHNNADISHIVQSVQFDLHHSFKQPRKILSHPPFEIDLTGWGEFEMLISLHFQPYVHEASIQFPHFLKLYHEHEPLPSDNGTIPPVKRIESEEIVFNKPRSSFYMEYKDYQPPILEPTKVDQYITYHDEDAELVRIARARKAIARATAETNRIKAMYDEWVG